MKEEKKNNTLVTFCGIVLGVYYVFIAFVSKYIANPITQKLLLLIGSIIIGAALISIIYKVTVVDTSSLFVGFGIVIIILFLLANKITFSPLKKGDKSY